MTLVPTPPFPAPIRGPAAPTPPPITIRVIPRTPPAPRAAAPVAAPAAPTPPVVVVAVAAPTPATPKDPKQKWRWLFRIMLLAAIALGIYGYVSDTHEWIGWAIFITLIAFVFVRPKPKPGEYNDHWVVSGLLMLAAVVGILAFVVLYGRQATLLVIGVGLTPVVGAIHEVQESAKTMPASYGPNPNYPAPKPAPTQRQLQKPAAPKRHK